MTGIRIANFALALALVLPAVPAMGAVDDYGSYRDWDYDRDGYLRPNEFSSHIYGLADSDKDGFLDDEEWSLYTGSWYDPYRAKYRDFSCYDTDGDGLIENGEFNSSFSDTGLFDKWDYDRNGYIDTNEWNDGIGIYQAYSAAAGEPSDTKSSPAYAGK